MIYDEVFFLVYRRIRELREDSDRTQAQVSQALGLTQRAYSYYETGSRMIPPWVLARLAVYYGTSVDYLLELTDLRSAYPRRPARK